MPETATKSRGGRLAGLLARALKALRGPAWWPETIVSPVAVGGRGLHVCVRCRRHFARPVEWESADDAHWRIHLRCADCGHEREAVASDAEAAAFDIELDRHESAMRTAADRLSRERMAEEIEVFAAALAGELIAADDFAR